MCTLSDPHLKECCLERNRSQNLDHIHEGTAFAPHLHTLPGAATDRASVGGDQRLGSACSRSFRVSGTAWYMRRK
jgi:hypothetical protein